MSLLTLNVIDSVKHFLATPAVDDPGLIPTESSEPEDHLEYIQNELEHEKLIKDLRQVEEEEGKPFKLSHQKILLTYSTHINKEDYIRWLTNHVRGQIKGGIKWIRLAHETADPANPYEHTHVVIDFGKRFQTSVVRFFDWPLGNIHPNISLILTKVHWNNAVAYLGKEDPENADLRKDKPSIVAGILACSSKLEAMEKYLKSPNQASGISLLYDLKPKRERKKFEFETLRPWQSQILGHIENDINSRNYYWFWGKANLGKSEFAKHIEDMNFPSYDWIHITQFGSGRDSACLMSSCLDEDWTERGIIIDLPRGAYDKELYTPIEQIKNGRFTNLKYQGRPLRWDNRPTIIIFANFPPKVFRSSLDRWRVYKIEGPLNEEVLVRQSIKDITRKLAVKKRLSLFEYLCKESTDEQRESLKDIMNSDPQEFDQDIMNALDTITIMENDSTYLSLNILNELPKQ